MKEKFIGPPGIPPTKLLKKTKQLDHSPEALAAFFLFVYSFKTRKPYFREANAPTKITYVNNEIS